MTQLVAAFTVLSMVFLAACGGGSSQASDDQVLDIGMIVSEPPSLDPAKAQDSQSGHILRHVLEGLVNIDKDGNPKPGIAKEWEVSDDGKEITFHLRDATWSNGDPVTAEDFEYAWKRVLNPDTGAIYAYQLFYLKNGEEYNAGEAEADEVGVDAVDDKTLKVELKQPTPYFISLTAFYTLLPVNKDVVEENGKWAANADTYVGNGAFTLDVWEHDSKIELKKNEDYWNADKVKLSKINVPFNQEEQTAYQLFKSGKLDYGDKNSLPVDLIPELVEKGEVETKKKLGSYSYIFNLEEEPFDNKKIRKAFALAIDRKKIVEDVTQGGEAPSNGWVPWGMPDPANGEEWVKQHGQYQKSSAQPEKAKELLEEGMEEEGIDKLPEITLDYNTDDSHKKIAEALQQMWKKHLDVDVKLQNSEWKVFLEKQSNGDFQMSRQGWLPDYIDPMTYLDMYTTESDQNKANWHNEEYDELIEKAKSTNDQKKRSKLMHEAEEILMEEMPIIPIYFYTEFILQKDHVKNVIYKKDASFDFREAYLTEE
ncbi:peptide ABC transporter substrate-binding protein [Paludifilum halophilum]|uniref:Solute-binding protein family 5 domain-containing protein n=1 Tax=Paludifilum halophilum TaxID=1642702 RepID=A0A235B7Q6_9BACL|nr:peptide ABC transporter substrate-binding protein [Paludifilum halophilum]OYD08326.1 hypothetical protein CHM34_05625 [Paludifilum halophilum]